MNKRTHSPKIIHFIFNNVATEMAVSSLTPLYSFFIAISDRSGVLFAFELRLLWRGDQNISVIEFFFYMMKQRYFHGLLLFSTARKKQSSPLEH